MTYQFVLLLRPRSSHFGVRSASQRLAEHAAERFGSRDDAGAHEDVRAEHFRGLARRREPRHLRTKVDVAIGETESPPIRGNERSLDVRVFAPAARVRAFVARLVHHLPCLRGTAEDPARYDL